MGTLVAMGSVLFEDDSVVPGSGYRTAVASAPEGAKVIAGGFKGENFDHPEYSTPTVRTNGPTDTEDGWQVTYLPNGLADDDYRLTVYATYVEVN